MKITIPLPPPSKGLITFDSYDLLFGYKFASKPTKFHHMVLIFQKENPVGMLPSANGIYIFKPKMNDKYEIRALYGANGLLVSGKVLTDNLAKVEKGKIVESKCWNNAKINLYDPESKEVQKFMCEVFGLIYSREMKLRQLSEVNE